MTSTSSPALRVALDYFAAWSRRDLRRAMTLIAEDIVCLAPAGRIDGRAAYQAFMAPFVAMLQDATMIAAFGDEHTALVMYDTTTSLVGSAPGAECVEVADGKITNSRFLFDRLPFDLARRTS